MRILVILPYVPSLIRVRPYNLLRQLTRRHAVRLLAVGTPADAAQAADLLKECHRVEIVPPSKVAAVCSCLTGALRGLPLQAVVCQSPELERRLAGMIASERFDVVHVEHLRAAYLGRFLPATLPAVYDSVDSISLLFERARQLSHSWRQRAIATIELGPTRRFEATAVRRFDRVVVTAPEDRRALEALAPGSSVSVVPNGVDLERFAPLTKPPEPATLIFTGKMSYHANVTAALHFVQRVYPRIRQERPDVRLRIVGSAPVPEIRALARDPSITVTGEVADLREAVRGATVSVCPITVKAGIQNKVLEAMAMGVPVVATSEGSAGLLAQPGEDLLVATTAAEFADQVCRLLADEALRQRLSAAGRRYVQTNHRWEAAAERFEELYQDAIERRGSAHAVPLRA
jgi:sugar transferase (PEP-CTERM/EpsH1 system associated)